VKILLDENFPLALVRELEKTGREVDHVITLGLRGAPDSAIIERLKSEEILFLTQDQEFLELSLTRSVVIVSHVNQSLPIGIRVQIWADAVHEYFTRKQRARIFELYDDGNLRPLSAKRSAH